MLLQPYYRGASSPGGVGKIIGSGDWCLQSLGVNETTGCPIFGYRDDWQAGY